MGVDSGHPASGTHTHTSLLYMYIYILYIYNKYTYIPFSDPLALIESADAAGWPVRGRRPGPQVEREHCIFFSTYVRRLSIPMLGSNT